METNKKQAANRFKRFLNMEGIYNNKAGNDAIKEIACMNSTIEVTPSKLMSKSISIKCSLIIKNTIAINMEIMMVSNKLISNRFNISQYTKNEFSLSRNCNRDIN